MTIHKLIIAVAVAAAGACAVSTIAHAETDAERFQGSWTVQKMVRQGKDSPEEKMKELRVSFEGDKFIVKREKKGAETSTFTLDETKNPKTIDMLPATASEKRPAHGIYKLEGDKLSMIWRKEGGERPADFDGTKAGGDAMFVVLAREKK
jgi:uncharacterized protein (TIGR03067 family)